MQENNVYFFIFSEDKSAKIKEICGRTQSAHAKAFGSLHALFGLRNGTLCGDTLDKVRIPPCSI